MTTNRKLEDLHNTAEHVILNVGDMIIDHLADYRGFLTRRIRHIDMVEDDVYLWEVKLFKSNKKATIH